MRRFGRLALATLFVSGGLLGACSGDRGSESDAGEVPPVSAEPDDRGSGYAEPDDRGSGYAEPDDRGTGSTEPDDRGTGTGSEGEPQSAVPVPAERSTSGSTSETDRAITERVRERIRAQEGLSLDAQEVTIRARDGVVTLQGPVATSEEKDRLAALTADESGVKRVNSRLEVGP